MSMGAQNFANVNRKVETCDHAVNILEANQIIERESHNHNKMPKISEKCVEIEPCTANAQFPSFFCELFRSGRCGSPWLLKSFISQWDVMLPTCTCRRLSVAFCEAGVYHVRLPCLVR